MEEFTNSDPFFGGSDKLGYVDIALLPWLSRMYVLYIHKKYNLKEELSKEEFDKFENWISEINSDQLVRQTIPEFYHTANVNITLSWPELVGYVT